MSAEKNFDKPLVHIFARYYKPHRMLFIADMLCASLIAAVDLFFPMLTKYTIEKVIPSGNYQVFFVIIGIMIVSYVLRMGFTFFVTYWGHTLGAYIEADMRRDLFGHLQKLPFSFYDNNRTGQIMSRVTTDLWEITELAHHGPEDLFISFLTLLGSFILVLTIRWEMALILVIAVPLMITVALVSRQHLKNASRSVKERTAEIIAALESSISGVRVAKAFTNEPYENHKFSGGNENYKNTRKLFIVLWRSFTAELNS